MSKEFKKLEELLENLLSEADPIQRPKSMADFVPQEKKVFSLDQAIDKYFVQYEREAIPTSEVYESNNLDNLTNYLFEQEDPEETADLDLGGGDAGGGADPTAGGGADPTAGAAGLDLDLGGAGAPADAAGAAGEQPAPAVQTPKINLQDFARSIARLVNNIQSLIDVKSIVLNRAEKYVQNNYDQATAKELVDILDQSYDLRAADQNNLSQTSQEFPQPRTAVTGPAGG